MRRPRNRAAPVRRVPCAASKSTARLPSAHARWRRSAAYSSRFQNPAAWRGLRRGGTERQRPRIVGNLPAASKPRPTSTLATPAPHISLAACGVRTLFLAATYSCTANFASDIAVNHKSKPVSPWPASTSTSRRQPRSRQELSPTGSPSRRGSWACTSRAATRTLGFIPIARRRRTSATARGAPGGSNSPSAPAAPTPGSSWPSSFEARTPRTLTRRRRSARKETMQPATLLALLLLELPRSEA